MKKHLTRLFLFLLIALPSALAYLPLAGRLGFYTDDWYSIYAAAVRGSQVFWQIFSFDRPARALLMIPLYEWFGANAALYTYSGYVVRLIGALALAWLADMAWPGRRWAAGMAGLVYLVYPGFLEQPKAFDYQSHLWSVSAALVAIALSVRAQLEGTRLWQRAGLSLASFGLTLFYLAQMEYFIGLEALRFLLIGYVHLRTDRSAWRRVLAGWLPALTAVAMFMAWRVFWFKGQRSDTDLSAIFTRLGDSGLQLVWLGVRLAQDAFNSVFSAWTIPLYQLTIQMRLRDVLAVGAAGVLAVGLVVGLIYAILETEPGQPSSPGSRAAMIWIGLAAALFALVPANLGGRQIEYLDQTRYALPVSVGVGLMAAGILTTLRTRQAVALAALFCGIGVTTQYANVVYHVNQWEAAREFWWQLYWRAPQLKPGTTLLAQYPHLAAALEYVTWGPANLIYYPDAQPAKDQPLPLSAVVAGPDVLQGLIMDTSAYSDEKGLITFKDSNKLLALWMPETGCMKALTGTGEELSDQVNQAIYLAAPYSKIDQIDLSGSPPVPDAAVFGTEPPHSWCYFYQKASLARQRGDWAEVARIGDEAHISGPDAADWVEYYPFIQGYANQGEYAKADNLARFVLFKPWLRDQACRVFGANPLPSGDGQRYLMNTFCR